MIPTIELVSWKDHFSRDEWSSIADMREDTQRDAVNHSCGFVVYETDEHLVLALTVSADYDISKPHQAGSLADYTKILKSCITSRRVL